MAFFVSKVMPGIGRPVILAMVAWAAAVTVLAVNGQFDRQWAGLPVITIGCLLLPPSVFSLLYRWSRGFRAWVWSLDIRPLMLLHGWRMVGIGFVFLAVHGQLAPIFAWPAGIGDAVAAVGATFLGIALYGRNPPGVAPVFAWSALGLLDFAVAVGLGILSRPGMNVFLQGSDTAALGHFPLALIPGLVVPFLILTHIVILINARRQLGDSVGHARIRPAGLTGIGLVR